MSPEAEGTVIHSLPVFFIGLYSSSSSSQTFSFSVSPSGLCFVRKRDDGQKNCGTHGGQEENAHRREVPL